MKCRRFKNEDGIKHIVWFGSYGKNLDGSAKFYNIENKNDNYSEKQQYIVDSITEKLSVLKYELWFNVNYGMPIIDKTRVKGIIDAYVVEEIYNNSDVTDIKQFSSTFTEHNYSATIKVISTFGELYLTV